MIGLEVESVDDKAKALAPYRRSPTSSPPSSIPMPTGCASAWSTPATGEPVQVVCGAPNARAGMKGVFAPPGTFIPGKNITLGKVGTIRGVESRGMLVLGARSSSSPTTTTASSSCRPMRRSASRYADMPGLDDRGDRDQPDAEPARLHRRPRHRARSRRAPASARCKDARRSRCKGEFPCPVDGDARLRRRRRRSARPSRCGWCAASRTARRPTGCRQRLRAIGLRPINALVDITNFITFDRGRPLHVFDATKVKGNLVVRRAKRRRGAAGARRQDLHARRRRMCVIADDNGVGIARRHHGRRGLGLRRDHHRRADRIGAVGPAQHRADRPQARHQLGCALPLRARRRSELHACRASSSPRRWCSSSAAARPSEIVVAGELIAGDRRDRLPDPR